MRVRITITGEQRLDGAREQVCQTADGRLSVTAGRWTLTYRDPDTCRPTVLRGGAGEWTVSHPGSGTPLCLRPGQRTACEYPTPCGILPVQATARELRGRLTAAGGTVEAVYTLDFGGGAPAYNTLRVNVFPIA